MLLGHAHGLVALNIRRTSVGGFYIDATRLARPFATHLGPITGPAVLGNYSVTASSFSISGLTRLITPLRPHCPTMYRSGCVVLPQQAAQHPLLPVYSTRRQLRVAPKCSHPESWLCTTLPSLPVEMHYTPTRTSGTVLAGLVASLFPLKHQGSHTTFLNIVLPLM